MKKHTHEYAGLKEKSKRLRRTKQSRTMADHTRVDESEPRVTPSVGSPMAKSR